jgi:hypothetical protein
MKNEQCLCSEVVFGFWVQLVIFWDFHNIVWPIQWATVCCLWRQLRSWSVSWRLSSCFVSWWNQRWVSSSSRWLSGYTPVSCSESPRFDSRHCWSLQSSEVRISSLLADECRGAFSTTFYSDGSNIRTPATCQPLYDVFLSLFISISNMLLESFMYYSETIFLLGSQDGSITSHYSSVGLPLTACST